MKSHPAVMSASVSLPTGVALATVRAGMTTTTKDLLSSLTSAGYPSRTIVDLFSENSATQSPFWKIPQFRDAAGVFFFSGVVFMVHMLVMTPWSLGIQGVCLMGILTLRPVRRIFKEGLPGLFRGVPTMDSLVALGVVASVLGSTYGLLTQSFHPFFHEPAVLLAAVVLGRLAEEMLRGGAVGGATRVLMATQPKTALNIRNGELLEIRVEEVKPGDDLLVRAGERVPVDAVVLDGPAAVDTSSITGESMPHEVIRGDPVQAGVIVLNSGVTLRATATVIDSRTARLARLVAEATASKAPIQRLADRVARHLTYFVISASAATFFYWWSWAGVPVDIAINLATSVMVVSCPCALGLAAPMATSVAILKSASHGIVFRDASAVETAGRVRTVILDKTGTLTTGRVRLVEVVPEPGTDPARAVGLAAAVERASTHPFAIAMDEYVKNKKISVPAVEGVVRVTPGGGVQGLVVGETTPTWFGNMSWLEREARMDPPLPPEIYTRFREAVQVGKSVVGLCQGSRFLALFVFEDTLRDEAPEMVGTLKAQGMNVLLLSGDSLPAVAMVAHRCGIPRYYGELLPEEKVAAIRDLKEQGVRVAMVGDGINDAPALALADLGVSVHGSTDVATEAACVTLLTNDLRKIPEILRIGKLTLSTIYVNLGWAIVYNVTLLPSAAGIFLPTYGFSLTPSTAGTAMAMSSLCVVLNSLWLVKKLNDQSQ